MFRYRLVAGVFKVLAIEAMEVVTGVEHLRLWQIPINLHSVNIVIEASGVCVQRSLQLPPFQRQEL